MNRSFTTTVELERKLARAVRERLERKLARAERKLAYLKKAIQNDFGWPIYWRLSWVCRKVKKLKAQIREAERHE
jgi:hypothetical protein